VGMILDETNFYAEAGGQLYDTGKISSSDGPRPGRERERERERESVCVCVCEREREREREA